MADNAYRSGNWDIVTFNRTSDDQAANVVRTFGDTECDLWDAQLDQECRVARQLRDAGEMTAREIADLLGVSRAICFRMVAGESVSAERVGNDDI